LRNSFGSFGDVRRYSPCLFVRARSLSPTGGLGRTRTCNQSPCVTASQWQKGLDFALLTASPALVREVKSIFEKKEPGGARSFISTSCGVAIDPNMSMFVTLGAALLECGDAVKKPHFIIQEVKALLNIVSINHFGKAPFFARLPFPPQRHLASAGLWWWRHDLPSQSTEGDQVKTKRKIKGGLQQQGAAEGECQTEIDHIQENRARKRRNAQTS
jgi:hypothetical protein